MPPAAMGRSSRLFTPKKLAGTPDVRPYPRVVDLALMPPGLRSPPALPSRDREASDTRRFAGGYATAPGRRSWRRTRSGRCPRQRQTPPQAVSRQHRRDQHVDLIGRILGQGRRRVQSRSQRQYRLSTAKQPDRVAQHRPGRHRSAQFHRYGDVFGDQSERAGNQRIWCHCSAPGSLDTSLSHAAGLIEIAACHA